MSTRTSRNRGIKNVLANLPPNAEISSVDPPKMMPFEKAEAVDHKCHLLLQIAALYENPLGTDVVFAVDNIEIKAHRSILAAQSSVLAKMFEDNHSNKPIKLPDKKSVPPFKVFLKYMYTGILDIPKMDLETSLELLRLSNELSIDRLGKAITSALKHAIDLDTVFGIFNNAISLEIAELADLCRNYLCENARMALRHPNFLQLQEHALVDIVSRDSFAAPEIEILMAVSGWYERNKHCNLRQILNHIRFELVNLDGMTMVQVAPLYEMLIAHNIDLKRLTPTTHLNESSASRRRFLVETENMATSQRGATVLTEGDPVNPNTLINGNPNRRCSVSGGFKQQPDASVCTYHSGVGTFITIRLGRLCRISSMLMVLKNNNTLGFTVQVSVDNATWEKLADCTQAEPAFSGPVLLMFPPKRMQYSEFQFGTRFFFTFYKYLFYHLVRLTGQADYDWFFILHFECPTWVTSEDRERYRVKCPEGGTLIFQRDTQRCMTYQGGSTNHLSAASTDSPVITHAGSIC